MTLTRTLSQQNSSTKNLVTLRALRGENHADYISYSVFRKTLRNTHYVVIRPPDMQKLATETVLKQAELIAEELVG